MKTINKVSSFSLFLFLLSCLVGCGQLDLENSLISDRFTNPIALAATDSRLAEVAIPTIIKELDRDLEKYIPQVRIITPQPEQTFKKTDISIELEVENLPIFRDDKLQLGNHLNLIIDNEPLQPIYSLEEPVVIKNLTPGTHSIRAFATRPWGESFKTEAAYAQTTFNVLTETNDNRPKSDLPLLTYNSPTGSIGAEPFLLDFYLTNAPLHAIAQNDPNLLDWRVRATVNGTSFILKNWQPTYLTGIKPGENWIQLELIDEAGNSIENAFNNTVRVFNYDPQQQDTLAKLVTNKIALADAKSIVEQKYYIQPVEVPEIIEPTVTIEPESTITGEEAENDIEPIIEKLKESKSEEDVGSTRAILGEKSDLSSTLNSDAKQVKTEKSEQPGIISTPETNTIDGERETIEDSSVKEINSVNLKDTEENIIVVESTESSDTITITQDNLDAPKPTVAIETPQTESAAITEAEISITREQTEPIKTPQPKTEAPVWWQKILVNLRQKLEGLVRLLPKDV